MNEYKNIKSWLKDIRIKGDIHMDIVVRMFLLMIAVMLIVFGIAEIVFNA